METPYDSFALQEVLAADLPGSSDFLKLLRLGSPSLSSTNSGAKGATHMTGVFGETLDFPQENGPKVSLVVNGDEYYGRYESLNGYTVIYDQDLGLYCYALLEDGKFLSSKISLSQPPPDGLHKHLEESESVRAAKVAAKLAARNPPD